MDGGQPVQSGDDAEQESVCVACYENAEIGDLKFCQCNYKIHHECLKMMLIYLENSALHDITGIQCLYCNSNVQIQIQPTKGTLVKWMENLSSRYKWFCEKLFDCVSIIIIQQALATYGIAFLYQIYGKQTASEIINSLDTHLAVGLCQLVPLVSIAISFSGWEDKLLLGLRRCSRLPVVGCVFPREYPRVRELSRRRKFSLNAVVDGLLLPLYGEVCGLLVCGSMEPGLPRLLLGAAAFLSLRGVLHMYYRQSRYSLVGSRTVANYQGQ